MGSGPSHNAFIKRFNTSYRYEVLDTHLFSTLDQDRHTHCYGVVNGSMYQPTDESSTGR